MSADHGAVLIDAHVHYHRGFARGVFFDAASRNLDAGSRQLGLGGAPAKVLMFTECAGVDAFGRFAAEAARHSDGDINAAGRKAGPALPRPPTAAWRLRTTGEANSLWVTSAGEEILLVAGRQIVTDERLEVLALGCRTGVAEGLPLRATRDAVIEAGGIPVIPWGFGKWWFSRGRRLRRLLGEAAPGRWFLGDNAGRPALSRHPALFRRAARHDVFVLPGSDPLPLAGQESKAGRCGFVMPQPLDEQRPAASLLAWLRDRADQPRTFGRYERLLRFGRDQLAMQLRQGRNGEGVGGTAGGTQPSSPARRGDAP